MTCSRIKRLQNYLRKNDMQSLLIFKPENRRYISGFTGTSAYILVLYEKVYLLTDFRYIEQASLQTKDCEIIDYGNDLFFKIKEILKNEKIKELYFEENYITYKQYKQFENNLKPLRFIPEEDILEEFRQVKDETEIKYMKKAASIADKAFSNILTILKPGISEIEVVSELEYHMKKLGSEMPSFETIVASGNRSSMPHGVASNKKIENGDFVLFDFGAVFEGYHSDMTRTVCIGNANSEQKELYNTVLKSQKLSLEKVMAGIKCNELDGIARDYLAEVGYKKEFGHSLGHGVGLEIHEKPRVSPNYLVKLQEGMTITIEPGVYIESLYGVRIEDLVVVTKTGCEIMTKSPKKLIEL